MTIGDSERASDELLALHQQILERVDTVVRNAEAEGRPLEVDPARGQLFELFVMAEAAGCVGAEAEPDLSADGLCAALADRWGLRAVAQNSVQQNTALPAAQMAKMRGMWSILRMWMEWTYAWSRWPEFHAGLHTGNPPGGPAGSGPGTTSEP